MGLDSLDVDTRAEENLTPGRGTASAEFEAAKRAAGLPTDSQPSVMSLGRSKGLGGFLGTPKYAARFRLDAVSNELLEPLSDLLGGNAYLLGTARPSSLDCLAFGYLALMLFPAVPQAWLKDTISTKFPGLATYVRKLRRDILADENVSAAQVWAISTGLQTSATEKTQSSNLPWTSRSQTSASHTLTGVQEVIGNIPVISSLVRRDTAVPAEPSPSSYRISSTLPSPLFINTMFGFTAAVAIGLVSLAVQQRRSPRDGELIFWALRPSVGLGEFSDMLSVGNILGQLPSGGFSQL